MLESIITNKIYFCDHVNIFKRHHTDNCLDQFIWGKIEESEKASNQQESNSWHPVLCHLATTTGKTLALTFFYMYCTGSTEISQPHTWQPLSMCHQNSISAWLEHTGNKDTLPLSYDNWRVQKKDCEGWCLFDGYSSVAEHWLHKPGILVSIPSDCRPFYFSRLKAHYRLYIWEG